MVFVVDPVALPAPPQTEPPLCCCAVCPKIQMAHHNRPMLQRRQEDHVACFCRTGSDGEERSRVMEYLDNTKKIDRW